MSWYPDLGTATQVTGGDHVWAVGWLAAGRPCLVGLTPPGFLPRLGEFYRRWAGGLEPLARRTPAGP
jgi:hypothetical protein